MKLRRLLHDDGGQTMVITAVALTSMLGMAAFSVDVGVMFNAKRNLQTAADAGAIAGAAEYSFTNVTTAAKAATAQNGMTDGVSGVTITVNNPPSSGAYATGGASANSTAVEVIATKSVPTIFMKIFGLSSMNVKARAVAALGPGSGCIFTLNTSGIDVGMSGSGNLSMPDCGIVINSNSANALNRTGSSDISALSIGISGGWNQTGAGSVTPTPITGVAPVANPLAFLTPPSFSVASCLANPKITTGSATLGPAIPGGTVCYNGMSISTSSTVTMNPGLYIINGGMSVSGSGSINSATVGGVSGVTFYFAPPNGSLSLTGSGALNLTAPVDKSNPYNGILFFEDPTDTNAMTISGSGGSNIQGVFYAPSALLNMTGSSGSQIYADLVVSSLSLSGTINLKNYATVNKDDPIASARMVE